MAIDVSKNYTATFNASLGEIVCELYPNTAPASIVRLRQSNQSNEANGPPRNNFSVFATTPCHGLFLSR